MASCSSEGIEKELLAAYEASTIDTSLKEVNVILIIPNAGCQGCISSIELLIIEEEDKLDDVLMIFTNYTSSKALRNPEIK